jgi:hypothetical protein
VGNNKSVKSVFSCHFGGAPLLSAAVRKRGYSSNRKAQTRQKAICANYGKVLFLFTYLDLQRVD